MNLFRTKPVASAAEVAAEAAAAGEPTLKRALSAHHLVALGIGAVIGAGIFVLTGHAAAKKEPVRSTQKEKSKENQLVWITGWTENTQQPSKEAQLWQIRCK